MDGQQKSLSRESQSRWYHHVSFITVSILLFSINASIRDRMRMCVCRVTISRCVRRSMLTYHSVLIRMRVELFYYNTHFTPARAYNFISAAPNVIDGNILRGYIFTININSFIPIRVNQSLLVSVVFSSLLFTLCPSIRDPRYKCNRLNFAPFRVSFV